MRMNKAIVCWILLWLSVGLYAASAENTDAQTKSKSDDASQIKARLTAAGLVPDKISVTVIPGVYEVVYGASIIYMSQDGRYLIKGEMIDMLSGTNLTKTALNSSRQSVIKNLPEDSMVIYPAKNEKHVLTVFTDINCGYCRKLHSGMDRMNQLGITVRYLFYPRTGLNTPSYEKAVSVWCSDDRNKALTLAKQGRPIPHKTCDNPVSKHFQLGNEMGIRGTPALIFADGTLLPGYLPPEELLKALDRSHEW